MADKPNGIPAGFVEMDPDTIRKAIAPFKPILEGEQRKLEALYHQHKYCPHGCGPTMEKSAGPNAKWAFQGSIVPRCLMTCSICGCTINPHDGMVVELGKEERYTSQATGAHIINIDNE